MKKKLRFLLIIVGLLISVCAIHTFAILKSNASSNKAVATADWSISRSQSASSDSIELIPGIMEDEYALTVTSTSEVNIMYKIMISNLSSGVEVALDDGAYQQASNGEITITNANLRINYSDANKTKTHTLHFRATSGATLVNDREIDVDVEFSQVV